MPVPVPTVVPDLPIPTVVPTPPLSTEQLQELVSDDLLDRINKFAFASAGRHGAGAGVQEAGPVSPTQA